MDRDKPNTPNSDVQYSIVGGNEAGKFGLESAHRAALVIRKPLDYDTGDKEFSLTLMASVSTLARSEGPLLATSPPALMLGAGPYWDCDRRRD